MSKIKNPNLIIGLVFLLVSFCIYLLLTQKILFLEDQTWFYIENGILAILSVSLIFIIKKAVKSKDAYNMLQNVYIVTFSKLITVAAIIGFYIFSHKENRHFSSILAMFGIYLFYHILVTYLSISDSEKKE